ncbi:MAG TPA: polysaccharide deacetylase family protein [Vicinamibacterales bacterium]|jgi:peptidoglycan-N-acetylglucosamine deacetylase|nr:polysaccharide deacetylase family protein [Vicinamibacterales bacterium]
MWSMLQRRKRTIWRAAIVLALAGVAAVGLREIVLSSTFQLFGDYVARVDTPERVVALTFDDGPSPYWTPKFLSALDARQVRATFFMMGRNVERYPAVAREVLTRGHEIGNHSYSHPQLIFMWPGRVREEIERTDTLLRGIGVSDEIHFRPPHAAKFLVLPYVLTQMNKLSVLGDVDPEEWKQRPAAVMTESILRQVRPGSIIGLHDPMGAESLQTLENILPALIAQGYRFETVSELVRRRTKS